MSGELVARHDLVVVGAGAAGLWAAARAAKLGRQVLLLEKTERAGTKVLASGGTRCNLTTTFEPDAAARLFGSAGQRFLLPAFRAMTPQAVRERFAELGVPTEQAALDKVFPSSQNAKDVRDALLDDMLRAGAELRTACEVQSVTREADGAWCLRLASGEDVIAGTLFMCPGGKSFPETGTVGDGYRWLAELDLDVVPPVQALVPLVSEASWVHDLTGLARQSAQVRLLDQQGKTLATRERPLLFTHFGLSGPAAMDVSGHVARAFELAERNGAGAPRMSLAIDLVPELNHDELRHILIEAATLSGRPKLGKILANLAGEPLQRRLIEVIVRNAKLPAGMVINELSKSQRHDLVETLKGLRVPLHGTRGWEQAEVTRGGLSLRALNPRSMQVNGQPGLFVFGELLDLDGPIGGLNFQAAFATAELAARCAAGGA